MSYLDRYRDRDGQPKVHDDNVRIALDVKLCEHVGREHGYAAVCQGPHPGDEGRICGRLAFRSVGDYPWVDCVCGHTFNANYSMVGEVPWPWPKDGKLVIEGEPTWF